MALMVTGTKSSNLHRAPKSPNIKSEGNGLNGIRPINLCREFARVKRRPAARYSSAYYGLTEQRMIDRVSVSHRFGRLATSLIAVVIGLAPGRPANGQAELQDTSLSFRLHSSEILSLAKSLASAKSNDSYSSAVKLAIGSPGPDEKNLTAFEENRFFVYAVVSIRGSGAIQASSQPEQPPQLVRRLVILKPSIFIVDDEALSLGSAAQVEWRLYSGELPEIAGQRARVTEGNEELSWEMLLPRNVAYQLGRESNGGPESECYLQKIVSPGLSTRTRFLHVLEASEGGRKNSEVTSKLVAEKNQWHLTIVTENRVYRLSLPPANEGAGDISISTAEGKTLLDNRPLASGILPHGLEGTRLLEQWDADYRGTRPPAWDIGRPSDQLQKVVSGGTVRACRVVDLCCGSGTDAIYLASRGFQVTAVDIAPTALSQGQQKARKAGVSVRWVLADVLAPPSLEPFAFIYDRGCYHVVRDQNLAAYLETVHRFSRPGTRFLLLAARREEEAGDQASEGVAEEELRYDFLPLFDLEWLRAIRLESNQPGIGPPGWSALLRRKPEP